jgi:hypothetical protein
MEVPSMSTKKSKGPLLYIHQPFARTPATNMQDTYTTREELVVEEEKPSRDESNKEISLTKKEIVPEQIKKDGKKLENPSSTLQTKTPVTSATTHQNRQHTTFNRVKPFKEMNMEERLDYLINYPKVLPPAPCVFVTEEKSYQGFLIEYDGQEATIRFHDQSTKTIPVQALNNVFLIGIKK